MTKLIFFYGIKKDGAVDELNSDIAFITHQYLYILKGDLDRKTPKGFPIFKYTLYANDKKIEDTIIRWGDIKCKLPEQDVWGNINNSTTNGVCFNIILNDTIKLTFNFQEHSIVTIKEIIDFLRYLNNHNFDLQIKK